MTVRQTDMLGKVQAAAAGGFAAVGVTVDDYVAAGRAGLSDTDLRAAVGGSGVAVVEIESPWDWAIARDGNAEGATEDTLFRAVDVLGCRQINAVQFTGHPAHIRRAGLDRLAERAERHGARVAVEFMPFSTLRTLADAWSLVSSCARPVDLVLDVWHLARSGGSPADLRTIPAEVFSSVQLSDAGPDPMPDVKHEARHHRLLPGHGVLDLRGILAELQRAGARPRMSVEVWSDALLELSATHAAQSAWAATESVLAGTALGSR